MKETFLDSTLSPRSPEEKRQRNAARLRKKEAILRRHFSKRPELEENQEDERHPAQNEESTSETVQQGPLLLRSLSTGRMTPLRKRVLAAKDSKSQLQGNLPPARAEKIVRSHSTGRMTPPLQRRGGGVARGDEEEKPTANSKVAASSVSSQSAEHVTPLRGQVLEMMRRSRGPLEQPLWSSTSDKEEICMGSTSSPGSESPPVGIATPRRIRRRDVIMQRLAAKKTPSAARECPSKEVDGDSKPPSSPINATKKEVDGDSKQPPSSSINATTLIATEVSDNSGARECQVASVADAGEERSSDDKESDKGPSILLNQHPNPVNAKEEKESATTNFKPEEKFTDGFNDSFTSKDEQAGEEGVESPSSFNLRSIHEHPTDESPSSFDLRSIHEHPSIDPEKQVAETNADPSWDANKVYFSEFEQLKEKTPEKAFDMFDTESWGAADISFPSSANRTLAQAGFTAGVAEVTEEKKEKEPFLDNVHQTVMANMAINEDEMEPTGWPRMQEGFQNMPTADPFEVESRTSEGLDDDDDESLLASVPCRSEAGLSDILGEYESSADLQLKADRLAVYTTTETDAASLEDRSEDEAGDETDEELEDTVKYDLQADEDDDSEDEKKTFNFASDQNAGIVDADAVPSFDVAAAFASGESNAIEQHAQRDEIFDTSEAPAFVAAEAGGSTLNEQNIQRNDSLKAGAFPASTAANSTPGESTDIQQSVGDVEVLETDIVPALDVHALVENTAAEEPTRHDDILYTDSIPAADGAAPEAASRDSICIEHPPQNDEIVTTSKNATCNGAATDAALRNTTVEKKVEDAKSSTSGEGSSTSGKKAELERPSTETEGLIEEEAWKKWKSTGLQPTPPPPPSSPPPESKKKRKKKKRRKPKTGAVPLIAPPPEEKLKRWEERKSKPSSTKSGTDNSDQPKAFSFEFSCDDADSQGATMNTDETPKKHQVTTVQVEGCITERNYATPKHETPCSDAAVMMIGIDQSPLSAMKTTPKSSPEKSLSPASASLVIQDTNFAERVDKAISAADSKFEKQASLSPSKSDSDLFAGAFSSWENCASPDSNNQSQDGKGQTTRLPRNTKDLPTAIDVQPVVTSTTSNDSNITGISLKNNTSVAEDDAATGRNRIFPEEHPSPFEAAVENDPKIVSIILRFLGDPVAVCRMKMTCRSCHSYISENEHRLMRDAVRLGGMSMNVRPYFWLWVTLQKLGIESTEEAYGPGPFIGGPSSGSDLTTLERIGREGTWHNVIERDVSRSFGNLPPHKTGARLRTDSIVRALVSWGQSRLVKHGVKGSRDPHPGSMINVAESDEVSLTPTDTVSDWGGVTPVGSFTSSVSGGNETSSDKLTSKNRTSKRRRRRVDECELALSGNALTEDMKAALQDKLSFILHALAAAHPDVGYCQGMDYVVAHLLRILQDTVRWKAANGTLPSIIKSAPRSFYGQEMDEQSRMEMYAEIDRSLVVEETCFRVMDSFFTSYNLRHFYWPELRCLKTCCLVFEKLIQIKLPVLADHFEHHELNVGLFALGWFQTLFLYLPSMPSKTVCHMWDIWLVERSYKIFFRVGTAILFLSQPILLNQELEGMMSYLNTFPDATLLSPDILIACALQIKVTNKMLMELEGEVTSNLQK